MHAQKRLCAVIPTYNERDNVARLLDEVRKAAVPGITLLFVDDSSPDGTGELIRKVTSRDPSVRLLVRGAKMGIGSAYQDGFREALSSISPDIIIEMDADLQHPPALIGELVKAVEAGADVAIGSRYVPGGGVAGWSRLRRVVSIVGNSYARILLGIKVWDATSGFRAYTRATAERVTDAALPAKGFEFQVASLYLLKGSRFAEVPYTFGARVAGKSKLGMFDLARFFFSVMKIALS